jgi:hypothetical protein
MRIKKSLVLIEISIIIIGTMAASSLTIKNLNNSNTCLIYKEDPITLKDDAFQYNGEDNWIEWWFYTMYDDIEDIQLLFSYSITLNQTTGFATMMVIGYDNNEKYDIRDYYYASEFNASYEKPNVTIGEECSMKAIDENTFILKGRTQNGKIVWNLTYNRLIKPYRHTGNFGWLCYIPSAKVTGMITIDGEDYNISGNGYHDHNWMTITYTLPTQWRWAETYDKNNNISMIFSIVGNYFFSGELALIIDNQTIIFKKPQISYSNFTMKLAISQLRLLITIYPKTWHIHADNGEYIADFEINIYKTQPLFLGGKTYLVNEQVSLFKADIKNNNNNYNFDTLGFSEYTRFRIFDLF